MIRPILSYALTSLILLAQGGLPLQLHYCKGALESISVFFNLGCDEHEEVAELASCCKKEEATSCSQKENDCCDNETKVLLQDFDSLMPHFEKWNIAAIISNPTNLWLFATVHVQSTAAFVSNANNTGPPIYIRHQSLILYA